MTSTTLRRTPFYFLHKTKGARLVEFAGWEMPVQFEGVMAEHRAVRQRAGVFDISHMGQVWVTGPGAQETLQRLVTNDVAALAPGRGSYGLLCREDGGVIDDLYVYRLAPDRFLVVVNASRVEVDVAWMQRHRGPDTELTEQLQPAALAVQGPGAASWIGRVSKDVLELKKNGVGEFSLWGREGVVARTGYTGEDGFEIFGPAGHVFPLYESLMKDDASSEVIAAGLGARDTLRLEMGYSLYGHELDEDHSPLEANLGWAISWNKGDFLGHAALRREKAAGSRRKLLAFRLRERGVPREKCGICLGDQPVGGVTSGTFSPSLNVGIALGYVDARFVQPSLKDFTIEIHGRAVAAQRVPLPFYKKTTS